MALFESMLILVLVAIVVLQFARGLAIPYPTVLAAAGVMVAALPGAPVIAIDPDLALALFIAPALLDAAYDLPPRTLRRNWVPLVALAGIAVLLTTAAVAGIGIAWGLPAAAAIALGAIVAPPDAAAAAAMLRRFSLPRRTAIVLQGESLLNDAVALLIFTWAVSSATAPEDAGSMLPAIALAVPGGIVVGYLAARLYILLSAPLAGTLGGTLFEFVATFGVWVIAERLHFSAILAVVVYGMSVARYIPERQSPRDRVHSYSVWGVAVFLLNVLAFLLMGLQAREIVGRLDPGMIREALSFAGIVLAVVVGVRIVWVLLFNRLASRLAFLRNGLAAPTLKQGIVLSWCGMRGLVTLAVSLALPADFPSRDLIVLSALAVVMGTLVLQGLTLGPLIRFLRIEPDGSFDRELAETRQALLDAALGSMDGRDDGDATHLRAEYLAGQAAPEGGAMRGSTTMNRLRRDVILAQRGRLAELRRQGAIGDDVFHAAEEDLDWAELAVYPRDRLEILEG